MRQRPGTTLSQSLVRLTVGLTVSLLLLAALLHAVALSGSEVERLGAPEVAGQY